MTQIYFTENGDLREQAYKYVPFGPVDEVMPFLIRRAQVKPTTSLSKR